MSIKLNKYQIERFSRQIVLKDVGVSGQKKIFQAKVLIVGMGGLGCPAAEFLTRAGIGFLGIVDPDEVDLSNIHRQSLFNIEDLKKSKVLAAKKKLKKINPKTDINCYNVKLNKKNCLKKLDFFPFLTIFADVIAFLDVLFACFALYFEKLKTINVSSSLNFKGS